MKNKTIQISAERYLNLLQSENELNALEYAGVDNWVGYGDHIEYQEDEDDLLDEVHSKIIS